MADAIEPRDLNLTVLQRHGMSEDSVLLYIME